MAAQTELVPSPAAAVLEVIIPGKPVPKGRPRVVQGGRRTYTPKRTAQWEAQARNVIGEAMDEQGWAKAPKGQPLHAEITVVFPRKKALRKTGGRVIHAVRPDLDNIVKAVKDALDVAMHDDGQIVRLTAEKFYAAAGEDAHIAVRLWRAP